MAHSVATPALLCHKEPAQGTTRGISCLSLVLYGIRMIVCSNCGLDLAKYFSSGVMEIFRTEFLEVIAKTDQIKAEVDQSVVTFSLQEEHRAEILEQVRLCALENIDTVGRSLVNQNFFDLALPIFQTDG